MLRPTQSNVPKAAFRGTIFGCIGAVLLTICGVLSLFVLAAAGAVNVAKSAQANPSSFNPSSFTNPDVSGLLNWITHVGLFVAIAVILIPIALIVLSAVIGGAREASNARDSYLGITPDGVVEALGRNRLSAIDFAALDDMTTLLAVGDSGSAMLVELHYRNGTKRTWHPHFRFGSDQSVAQRVIRAFQDYSASANARMHGIQ